MTVRLLRADSALASTLREFHLGLDFHRVTQANVGPTGGLEQSGSRRIYGIFSHLTSVLTWCTALRSRISTTLTHMTHRVGVRALQQNASEVVKRAAAGEIVDITDRGRLVAHMIPAKSEGMAALRNAGLVRDARHSAAELPPPLPRDPDQPTLGEVLAEQRAAER